MQPELLLLIIIRCFSNSFFNPSLSWHNQYNTAIYTINYGADKEDNVMLFDKSGNGWMFKV